MFGPTTWICLPGNGWKEQSPWMSLRAQPDGWEGIHPLLSHWNGQRFVLVDKTPARLRSARGRSLCLCEGCLSCVLLTAGIGQSHPLEARTGRWPASSSLSSWEGCCWNSLLQMGKVRLREAYDLPSVTQQGHSSTGYPPVLLCLLCCLDQNSPALVCCGRQKTHELDLCRRLLGLEVKSQGFRISQDLPHPGQNC